MKRIMISTWCILGFFVFSCNNGTEKKETHAGKETTTSVKTASGPEGTYTTTENNMPMQFILKADGKGNENYHGDMRPFTWKMKDGKIFFVYDGETTEFELPIDFEKGEIHYGSLVYKKE